MSAKPLSSNSSTTMRSMVIAKPTLFDAKATPEPSTMMPRIAGVMTSRL